MPDWTTIRYTREQRLEAFFKKIVECESGCHEFIGAINSEGYGNFWDEGVCKKAHRFAWEAWNGPIPKGQLVLHKCDNPPCCNPDHLYLGTDAQNTHDKVARGRMSPTSGMYNPSNVLTENQILEIHGYLRHTTITQQQIADMFNVSKGHINNIKAGRVWFDLHQQVTDATFTD